MVLLQNLPLEHLTISLKGICSLNHREKNSGINIELNAHLGSIFHETLFLRKKLAAN